MVEVVVSARLDWLSAIEAAATAHRLILPAANTT